MTMTTPLQEPLALRPAETIKRYRLPRDRVYTAIQTGELRAINVGSPRRPAFILRITDIEAWLDSLVFEGKKK